MENKQIVSLGCMNGWTETPQILKNALAKGFRARETGNDGRGWHQYEVETDDKILRYSCDSSD